MADYDVESSAYTSYYTRMTKLTDNELRREYVNLMAFPKGGKNYDVVRMKIQMLQVLAKERGILL